MKLNVLSIPEFAERKGVDQSTVNLAVRAGKIRSQRVGLQYLIPESELTRWDPVMTLDGTKRRGRPKKNMEESP